MKALIVEDEPLWADEIELALLKAMPSLRKDDMMKIADPESARKFLQGGDGAQYRIVLLDWGFVRGGEVTSSADLADIIKRDRKDVVVILLTGARKDKRVNQAKNRDEILDALIKANTPAILKYEVSRKLDSPDSGLPKLVEKLKELNLEEMLRQRALSPFRFQSDNLAVTVRDKVYQLTNRQMAMAILLHEKFLTDKPGLVTKVALAKAVNAVDKTRGKVQMDSTGAESVKDWDPNDEFKETTAGINFWRNHVSFGTQKGRYFLVETKEHHDVVVAKGKSSIAKPNERGTGISASARTSTST